MLCYSQGLIDDAEFLILSCGPSHPQVLYKPRNLDLRYSTYLLFNLEDVDDDEYLAGTRFKNRDIPVEASFTKYQVRIYMDDHIMDDHIAWT